MPSSASLNSRVADSERNDSYNFNFFVRNAIFKALGLWGFEPLSRVLYIRSDSESFRAAGDAIFLKKKEQDDQLATSHAENLKGKLALLEEAEAIDTADLKTARSKIGSIQTRWSKFGHVPKDQVKSIEGRLRAVESKIASAEKEAWQRSDPAAKARSSSLVSQLEAVIANLEKEMVAAPEPKKKEIQSQIESRKALLVAAQNAVD